MEPILYIGIAQFLFAALLTFSRKPLRIPDYILGLWLLLMTIFMGLTLLKISQPDSLWGRLQLFPFAYTFGPFVYLYVRTLISERPQVSPFDLLHLLPFAFFSVLAVALDTPVDEEFQEGRFIRADRLLYSLSAFFSIVAYSIGAMVLINQHRRNLLNYFSYQSGRINLNWLRLVAIGFSLTYAITLLATFYNALVKPVIDPGLLLFLGFTVIAFGISFFGARQPDIFQKTEDARFVDLITPPREALPEIAQEEEKYYRSSLTQEQATAYIVQIKKFMEEEKAYLQRDLNLQKVAESLDIPPHHLTETLNEYLGKNFYTLVNEYRIEEVKKRLLNPDYEHYTFLAIARDSGFNSKSAFNLIFKKFTGMTPSEFRQQNKSSDV